MWAAAGVVVVVGVQIAGGSLETGVERLGPGRQEEQLDDQTRRFREQVCEDACP